MSFGVPATHLWPSGRGWLPFLGLPSDLVARYLWDAIMTHVTEQSLLRGAVYALEQCGLLLHDANTLYRSGSHATDTNLLMAGNVMSMLPMLILFIAAQRYFVRGIATQGLKG